jgi:nucleoside-diphosphate-sugar epimerase
MGAVGRGGVHVRALAMPGEDTSVLAGLGAEVVFGDIRAAESMRNFMNSAQGGILIHLAGLIHPKRSSHEFIEVNVEGTQNLLTVAQDALIAKAIVMSSNSPVGVSRNPAEVFDEESPYKPYMGYGRSKQLMEQWLHARFTGSVIPQIVIIRAPWFYGPDQPARQSRFFSMIRSGKFPLMGEGRNRRSMAYIDSLAFGILLAATTDAANGRTYWIADERPYRMKEIVDTVRNVLREDFGMSVKPTTVRVPAIISDFARLADRAIQKVGLYNQEIHVLSEMNLTIACTIDRAKKELGYRPLVELREGMRRSVDWCLKNNHPI